MLGVILGGKAAHIAQNSLKYQPLTRLIRPARINAQRNLQTIAAHLIWDQSGASQAVETPAAATGNDVIKGAVYATQPYLGPSNGVSVRLVIADLLVFKHKHISSLAMSILNAAQLLDNTVSFTIVVLVLDVEYGRGCVDGDESWALIERHLQHRLKPRALEGEVIEVKPIAVILKRWASQSMPYLLIIFMKVYFTVLLVKVADGSGGGGVA